MQERDGAFFVYSEDDREIGNHPTRELADRQVAAVEKAISKRTDSVAQPGRLVYRNDYVDGARAQALKVDKTEHIAAGGIIVDAILARSGIQVYRKADGTESREYEPPEEIRKALDSYREIPLAIDHPPDFIDPDNYADHGVGHVAGKPTFDGHYVKGKLAIFRRDAIDGVESGELVEGSGGYTAYVEDKAGVLPNGEKYDAIKRGRVMNHHALLKRGDARGGPEIRITRDAKRTDSQEERMKLTIDGTEAEYDEAGVRALLAKRDAALAEATKRASEAQAKADAAEAERVKLSSPQRIADAVAGEVARIAAVRSVLGEKYETKGAVEDRLAVIKARLPGVKLDGRDDAALAVLFETALVTKTEDAEDKRPSVRVDGRPGEGNRQALMSARYRNRAVGAGK